MPTCEMQRSISSCTFNIDFNVKSTAGSTPLHLACCHGQFEVVKYLLENSKLKGIDITTKNNHQRTPEDLARQKGHSDILELLKSRCTPNIDFLNISLD